VISGENNASIGLFSRMGYNKCAHLKEVGLKFGRKLDIVYYQKTAAAGYSSNRERVRIHGKQVGS
jgi:L-amino acid N-acyltransferase YncA